MTKLPMGPIAEGQIPKIPKKKLPTLPEEGKKMNHTEMPVHGSRLS